MKYLNMLGLALLLIPVLSPSNSQEISASGLVAQVVAVDADYSGKIKLNGQDIALTELSSSLQNMSLKAAAYAVLQISPDMPMDDVNDLMAELRVSNISGISYELASSGTGVEFFQLTK